MKGVSSITKNGSTYWYARVDGKTVYCGIGQKGYDMAVAARKKYEAKQYESRQSGAGLEVKRTSFRTITQMVNWYIKLSTAQKKKSYEREVQALKHILDYFGKMPVGKLKGSDTVKYRDKRTKGEAFNNTIDYELAVLRHIYNTAIKLDELPRDASPSQFVMEGEVNPRPIVTE